MSITKPFHRNYRPIIDGPNSGYSNWAYIVDKEYSKTPEHYTRAYLLIQDDLRRLFEFVEPSDKNLETFSYRIHEIIMRTCIEVEANFKAILRENIYNPVDKKGKPILEKNWSINNFKIVNKTHHLSSYSVEVLIWNGCKNTFRPFDSWKVDKPIPWYQAYNQSKHDRQNNFLLANFENLMNSVSGLLVLLSSQFNCENFSPGPTLRSVKTDSYYTGNFGIGGFFIVNFPDDYIDDEKYDFNWSELKEKDDRFEKIDFDNI